MTTDIVSLAEKLIALETTPENPKALKKALALAAAELKGFTIETFEQRGVSSLLAYNAKVRPKKFKIILNGHLDVIPGKKDHYAPRTQGNRLYGVGSMDMKANVACLIAAFKDCVKDVSYPLGLQLVTDEEIGGFDGTKYQVEQGVRADFVIAGEPTNFDIVNKAKGVLWIKIRAKGEAAHGAYPWRGENAIWKMHGFLDVLKKRYPIPTQEAWVTTVNVSGIEAPNRAFNKIPDACSVALDIRYIPEDARTIVKTITKELLPRGFTAEIVANESHLATDSENEYVRKLRAAGELVTKKKIAVRGAQGSSDARHFVNVGSAGIEFGPVGHGIGSDDEWVDIPSLDKYHQILISFLRSL